MDLHFLLRALRRGWAIVLVAVLAAGGLGALVVLTDEPRYESRAKAFVSLRTPRDSQDLTAEFAAAQEVVDTYVDLASTAYVLARAARALDDGTTAADLADSVTAAAPTETAIITVSAQATDAERSRLVADAVAQALVEAAAALLPPQDAEAATLQITVVQPAAAGVRLGTAVPVRLALFVLGGLVVGVLLALLRQRADARVRRVEDVQALTDRPVLARIPRSSAARRGSPIVPDDPSRIDAEAYRSLRAGLQFFDLRSEARLIVVTSSVDGEGKTSVAANLAISAARAGQEVVVVDADLRRPRLDRALGIVGGPGLTDVLIGRAPLDDALQPWVEPRLSVVTAGERPPNPSELIASDAMADLLDRLRARASLVVLDSPPLLPVADGAVLAARAGGALYVCRSGRATAPQLRRGLKILDRFGARTLGIVMTAVPRAAGGSYG